MTTVVPASQNLSSSSVYESKRPVESVVQQSWSKGGYVFSRVTAHSGTFFYHLLQFSSRLVLLLAAESLVNATQAASTSKKIG